MGGKVIVVQSAATKAFNCMVWSKDPWFDGGAILFDGRKWRVGVSIRPEGEESGLKGHGHEPVHEEWTSGLLQRIGNDTEYSTTNPKIRRFSR